MPGYDAAFKAIALNAIKQNPPEPGDYKDKDGNLICGKCHTPRSEYKEFFGEMMYLPITCKCRQEAEERNKLSLRVARLRENSGIPEKYKNVSFETNAPDPENERSIRILKRYVEVFPELYKKNQGLVIYGNTDTGKSHIAVCVAHGIINQGYSVMFVSLSKILQQRSPDNRNSSFDEEEFMDKIRRVNLLILDDFGTERGTSYGLEFVYSVINERYNTGKPVIITTNISFDELKTCEDLQYKRIYKRLLEVCSYPIEFKGESKRLAIAADKFDAMNKLLEVDDEHN